MLAEKNEDVVCILEKESFLNVVDTLILDTFKFVRNKSEVQNYYLTKISKSGQVTGAKEIGVFNLESYTGDRSGNVYLSGQVVNMYNYNVNNNKINRSDGKIFCTKINKNYKTDWIVQFGDSIRIQGSKIKYSNGKLLFYCRIQSGNNPIGTITYQSINGGWVYGELDTSDGQILWSKRLSDFPDQSSYYWLNDLLFTNNNLFLVGGSNYNLTIGSKSIHENSGFIIQTSLFGVFKNLYSFKSKNSASQFGSTQSIFTICSDNKDLFVGGCFSDSVYWGSDSISPGYQSNSGKIEMFMGALSFSLKPKWFYRPRITDQKKEEFRVS